jgi:lipopolysaccharide biosynthesis glycosyltransferase
MFNLKGYDQVIWFDIDMLVLNSLDKLFNMRDDNNILACEDILVKSIKPKHEYERDHKVQGGLIVVGKNLINEKVYNDLIGLLEHAYKYVLNDQSMFVEYFGGSKKLKTIDPVFNLGRKLVSRGRYRIEDVLIIHYPGSKKPKDLSTNTYRKDCTTFSLWHKVEKEMRVSIK